MNDDGLPQSSPMSQAKSGEDGRDVDGIICEAKKRFAAAQSAESENYKLMRDDLNFLKGEQWPERQKQQREAEGRVCLTINKIPTFLQQVTNEQRQNGVNMKVSPVSEDASMEMAEILQGVIKHIEYASSAESAYDTAANSAAAIGLGYFRFTTEYESDDSFDQVIRVKRIRNVFTVHMDPSSVEADGSDSQWYLISERMTKTEFKAKYPKAECPASGLIGGSVGDELNKDWIYEDEVRVAEYYRVEFTGGKLRKYADGSTEFIADPDGADEYGEGKEEGEAHERAEVERPEGDERGEIIAERDTVQRKIMWYLLTPYEILEQTEIKSRWIPVFPVYGTEIDVDGKVYRAGLVRNAKDPAMMYNFWMTSATEEVSLRTKTPWIVAEGQLEGHERKWNQANSRTFPYLEYKPTTVDDQMAPPPQRQQMADVPVGVLSMAAHASDNIKQTTGLFDSSLGAAGNATSGRQELAQQRQGNVTNFHYTDNLYRTLRQAGRVMLDMVRNYYDAERIVTCRGMDGEASPATINKWDEAAQRFINDISVGRYDIAVDPGPSASTMRAEAAEALVKLVQANPDIMKVAGDKVIGAMSFPGSDVLAERLAKTIPAQLREGEEGFEGKPELPPEVQQEIAQLKQQLEEKTKLADANEAKLMVEESRSKTVLEQTLIQNEGKLDVEEIKGMIALLLQRMQPPPMLAAEVAGDQSKDDGRTQPQEQPQQQAAPAPEQQQDYSQPGAPAGIPAQ